MKKVLPAFLIALTAFVLPVYAAKASIEDLKLNAANLIHEKSAELNVKDPIVPALVKREGNIYEGYAYVKAIDPIWGTDTDRQLDFDLIYDGNSVMLKFKGFSGNFLSEIRLGTEYKNIKDFAPEQITQMNKVVGVQDAYSGAFYPLGSSLTEIFSKLEKVQPLTKMRVSSAQVMIGAPSVSTVKEELKGAVTIYRFDCSSAEACLLQGVVLKIRDRPDLEGEGMEAATLLDQITQGVVSETSEPNFVSVNGQVVPNPNKKQ